MRADPRRVRMWRFGVRRPSTGAHAAVPCAPALVGFGSCALRPLSVARSARCAAYPPGAVLSLFGWGLFRA
ncbi:hypothetical protein GCM10010112_52350 [Actinoplanes lobatus]|nr:hypothetical protein GCM10010112_52350 [Actinoplanes lobatus]